MSDLDLRALAASMPFAATSGVEIREAAAEQVTGTLVWSPERCTVGGALHGGALMTLADSVGAVCAFLHLPDGAATSTISSATSFLRPVREGTVTAIARPLHVGRAVVAVQTELFDQESRRVAHVVQHQAVLRPD
jgi:1,4-dihydroxy-2-naphthoyl-CoA hydrolase